MPRIDAHQHFWDLRMPFDYEWLKTPRHAPICRSYLPKDLQPHLKNADIDKTVFVQTQHNLDENRWALTLAQENEWIAGVVGWVDLASPDVEQQICEFKDDPLFVGVRHITQDEPDDDFIIREDVIRGLKQLEKHGVPFDLLFYVKHLRHAETLAQNLPDLPMVIDHLAKPHIRDHVTKDWLPDFQDAAAYPNVYCKLSGLITEANWKGWTVDDLRPYVERALEAFGPDRCLFGSDWPVCELAGSYEQVHEALATILDPLTENEKSQIFGDTAARFYKLTR
ncbi:MAG: amidohydrolase family protein [Planctomycetaceae bacterium]|nr:amidohydrolase family protein [Planctomycetaceae bacterium]